MKVATVCVCASLLKIEGEHHPLCPCAPSADEILASTGNNVAYVRDGLTYTVTDAWRLHDTDEEAVAIIDALKAQRKGT